MDFVVLSFMITIIEQRIQQRTDITTYDGTGIEQCNICLNDFAIGDEIQITPCEHRYHRECLT